MIYLYSGTPGSGKSYHAVITALRYLKRKKFVICNFPLRVNSNNFLYKDVIDVKDLVQISMERRLYKKEGSGLIVFDEAGIMFNSRDFMQNFKKRNEWIKFFSQHRKLGYDIVLVAQDDRMIDRQIRNMIEIEVRHLSIINELLSYLPIKITVTKWYQVRNMRGSVGILLLMKKYMNMYDTMRMFDVDKEFYRGKLKELKVIDSNIAKEIIVSG